MKKEFIALAAGIIGFTVPVFPISENNYLKTAAYCCRKPETKNQDISEQIKKAFGEVEKGSYSASNDLIKKGEAIYPFIEPYLDDSNTRVRNEVVRLALAIRGEKALGLISKALTNSRPEVRMNAADNLFVHSRFAVKYQPLGEFNKFKDFLPEKIAAYPAIGEALKANVRAGESSLPSIFLLANFPDKETADILKKLSSASNYSKLDKTPLAANIVLAKLKDNESPNELFRTAASEDVDSLMFLLENIDQIDSMEILNALSNTFGNKTYISKGDGSGKIHTKLRNGTWVEHPIARRLCDLAINSYVEKFNLKISFGLHSGIYRENQIAEVRSKIKNLFIN